MPEVPAPKKHYHVLQGLRGLYMPDSNAFHSSRKSAMADAADEARRAREDGYKVSGSARSGFYAVGDANSIEITACWIPGCKERAEW